MKTKLIALFFPLFLFALSQNQLTVMHNIMEKAKPFNLSYTMAAIAWKESSLGKNLINLSSGDCGVFQVSAKTLSNNEFKQNRICQRLILDFDFSFSVALERYKYFYNYYRSKGLPKGVSWKRAICSYHAGWNWKKGVPYYKAVVRNIRVIREIIISLD